jgi:hypothetical protein
MGWQVSGMDQKQFVVKLKGRKLLARPKCKWEDNTEMNLIKMGLEGANWFNLALDRDQWWRSLLL